MLDNKAKRLLDDDYCFVYFAIHAKHNEWLSLLALRKMFIARHGNFFPFNATLAVEPFFSLNDEYPKLEVSFWEKIFGKSLLLT